MTTHKDIKYVCPTAIKDAFDKLPVSPFPMQSEWDIEEELLEYKAMWWPQRVYVRYFTQAHIVAKAKWLGMLTCIEIEGMLHRYPHSVIAERLERRAYALSFMRKRYKNPLLKLLEIINAYLKGLQSSKPDKKKEVVGEPKIVIAKELNTPVKKAFFEHRGMVLSPPQRKAPERAESWDKRVHHVRVTKGLG